MTRDRRSGSKVATVLMAVATACVSAGVAGGVAHATAVLPRSVPPVGLTNPRAGRPYRHGAIPLKQLAVGHASTDARQSGFAASGASGGAAAGGRMTYHGGAVVTGQPKVYLVFWGSQWGSQSTSGGYQVFSGDPVGMAPYLQGFFAGLGTSDELWSATAIQYCQGVALKAKKCAAMSAHVQYPTGGVRTVPVWEDTSYNPPTGPPASPSTPGASATRIAQEAASAAAHFGDTSPQAQYVIVSPTGANPDGWADASNGYCAYHSSTSAFLAGPDVAYTNLPYVTDAPSGGFGTCSSGVPATPAGIDAVTEVAGHEYYETLTDPFPVGAWYDTRGNEIADKCQWIGVGQPGGPTNLALATGNFPVQSMWANDANGGRGDCVLTHSPILVTTPARQISAIGTPVQLQISATNALPGQSLTYSAANLPTGLTINNASGRISGTPSVAGRATVAVTVAHTPNSKTVSFRWVVRRH